MTGVTVTLAEIREAPLSVDEVLRSVAAPRAGGICVFVGTVRDTDEGRGVIHLDYSAHPLAASRTRELAERLDATGRTVRIAVVHRVGHLTVGDLAIVAAVSAEHRAEAFEVCRALVDELKATVPIWKHQRFTDGLDEWVGLP
ncbi:molybdenum cofactor biosynthesis protein MoaE [Intrasporangium sp.]|uniref:molybdenum cofactor biosynthesis protein MoaE n=1 Tax=Intrasporangium sp. TaxID=1925024 RepID=UPI003221922F